MPAGRTAVPVVIASAIIVLAAIAAWTTTGLRATYFAGSAWQTRLSSTLDRHVTTEEIAQDDPVPLGGPFSVRWTGAIYIPRAGRYACSVFSEGGAASVAIDRTAIDGPVSLAAGVHPIVVAYAHEGGRYGIGVQLGREGEPLEPLRASDLSPSPHSPLIYIATAWLEHAAVVVLVLWLVAGASVCARPPRWRLLTIFGVTVGFIVAVISDRPGWIRGPAPFPPEWQWDYHAGWAVVGTAWPLLAAAIVAALSLFVASGARAGSQHRKVWIGLAAAPLAALVFQLAVMHLEQGGAAATLVRETMSAGDNSYFYVASHSGADAHDLLATFVASMPTLPIHAQTHPPGPVLYYRTLVRAFEAAPRTSDIVVKLLEWSGVYRGRLTSPDSPDTPPMVAAAFVGGLGLLLAICLTCWAVAAMVRAAGTDMSTAAQVALLWAVCPAAVAFSPQFDQMTTSLVACACACACWALKARRRATFVFLGVMSGVSAGVAFFVSFAAIPMLVAAAVLAFVLAGGGWREVGREIGREVRRIVALAGCALVGMAAVFAGPTLAGYNHIRAARFALDLHLNHYTAARSHALWLRFNLLDFSVFVGWTLLAWGGVLIAASLADRGRGRSSGTLGRIAPALTMIGLVLAIDLADVTRGEVGRLWMPLMPLMYAAIGVASVPDAVLGGASDRAASIERVAVAILLAVSTIVVNLYWGF